MIRDNIFIELRGYLSIMKRRWPFLVIPALMVLALSVLQFRVPPPSYVSGTQFIVGQPASPNSGIDSEQRQYDWITSQYVVNGVTDWANGSEFTEIVRGRLIDEGMIKPEDEGGLSPTDFAKSVFVETIRSRMTILVEDVDEERTQVIMEGIIAVLNDFSAGKIASLPQVGNTPPAIQQIDIITVQTIPGSVASPLMNSLFRVAVAVVAGLIFALLVEYIDPRVYEKRQLEAIHIPVLGSIPRNLAKVD